MRAIDADALMDDIKRDTKKAIDEGDKAGSFWLGYAAGSVIAQPTIQPEKTQLSKEGTTSDLISRTETVEHLRRMLEATVPNTDYDEGFVDGAQFAISTVSTMPPAQPEPQEGEWVLKDHLWECNKCGCRINVKNPLCGNNLRYYFCPHCGTKMIIAVQRF